MGFFSKKTGDDYYNKGFILQEKGNYVKSLQKYKKAAENFNHPSAQFAVSLIYYNGYGVSIDYKQAMLWSKRAANAGHIQAHYIIGVMYKNGEGVNVNYKEAVNWFKTAAIQGHYQSQLMMSAVHGEGSVTPINNKKMLYWLQMAINNDNIPTDNENSMAKCFIGLAYQNGIGVDRNDEIALKWFMEGAEEGASEAQCLLGALYMSGFGVSQDYKRAIYWFNKAVSSDNEEAKIYLGYMYENGLGVEQDKQKAKKYFDAEFKEGIETTMCKVGENYLGELRGLFDPEKALYWFERAAKTNNVRALLSIGAMYLAGFVDGKKDIEKAFNYISRAANITQVPLTMDQLIPQNHSDAEEEPGNAVKWYIKLLNDGKTVGKGHVSNFFPLLGFLYHNGLGVPQDLTLAQELYQNTLICFGDDDTDANMCMGLIYLKGLRVAQNFELAMAYFERSAKSINTYTYNLIGDAYKFGRGVKKDYAVAMEWYRKGAFHRDEYSQFNIGMMHLNGLGVEVNIDIALEWFQKAYNNGCREARKYIPRNLMKQNNIEKVKKPLHFFHLEDSSTVVKSDRKVNNKEVSNVTAMISSLSISSSSVKVSASSDINRSNNNVKQPLQFFHLDDHKDKKPLQFFHLDGPSS